MAVFREDLVQGTDEWLEWREEGSVGGSDLAALFGISPYKTKRELYFQKSGISTPQKISSYVANRGHKTEEALRVMYSEKLGMGFEPVCVEFDHGLFVSLDGYNKKYGMIEFKQVGKDVFKEIENGTIPPHHEIQVQAGILATSSKKGLYCAGYYEKVDGKEVLHSISIEVKPDKKMHEEIIKELKQFNKDLMSMKIPELSPEDTKFITDEKAIEAFESLETVSKQISELKEKEKALKKALEPHLDHEKVNCNGISFIRFKQKGGVDYTKIPELKGVDLDKYRKADIIKTKFTFRKEEK